MMKLRKKSKVCKDKSWGQKKKSPLQMDKKHGEQTKFVLSSKRQGEKLGKVAANRFLLQTIYLFELWQTQFDSFRWYSN